MVLHALKSSRSRIRTQGAVSISTMDRATVTYTLLVGVLQK